MSLKNRVIMYPKDVAIITGKSDRYGRHLLARIRDHLGKSRDQMISIREFCEYTGLPIQDVEARIL